MIPEAHERAEELIVASHPASDQFRNEAEKFLDRIKRLKPRKNC